MGLQRLLNYCHTTAQPHYRTAILPYHHSTLLPHSSIHRRRLPRRSTHWRIPPPVLSPPPPDRAASAATLPKRWGCSGCGARRRLMTASSDTAQGCRSRSSTYLSACSAAWCSLQYSTILYYTIYPMCDYVFDSTTLLYYCITTVRAPAHARRHGALRQGGSEEQTKRQARCSPSPTAEHTTRESIILNNNIIPRMLYTLDQKLPPTTPRGVYTPRFFLLRTSNFR